MVYKTGYRSVQSTACYSGPRSPHHTGQICSSMQDKLPGRSLNDDLLRVQYI